VPEDNAGLNKQFKLRISEIGRMDSIGLVLGGTETLLKIFKEPKALSALKVKIYKDN